MLAPGPRDRPLQYIDARDLATWMLAGAQRRLSGTFNAVGPPGTTTMGRLLDAVRTATRSDAQLVWVVARGRRGRRHRPVDRDADLGAADR